MANMLRVNTTFLHVKLIYFFFYASASCLMSYKAIFQKSLGMSPAQNGILQSVERFVILCFPPVIGALTDIRSQHKLLLTLCIFLMSALLFPGYFIPPVSDSTFKAEYNFCNSSSYNNTSSESEARQVLCNRRDDTLTCYNQNTTYEECINITGNQFTPQHLQFETDNCTAILKCFTSQLSASEPFGLTFLLLLIFTIVYALVSSPIGPLLDATTFEILAVEKEQNYGRQRMFGSIGFGVGSLATGYFIDVYSKAIGSENKDYLFVFIMMAALGVIATVISLKLKVPHHTIPSILPGLKLIFTSAKIFFFVWIVVIHGIVQSIKYTYLFWYGEGLAGSSTTMFGLAALSDCLSEVPMFFISNWIIKKLGHKFSLFLGLLCASLRTFLYAYLTDAWQMVLLEAINGVAFALPIAAMCSYVFRLAPDGMTTTLMSLIQGLYWGLANVIGTLLGGFLYESYGAQTMFKLTAALGVFGAFSFYFMSFLHLALSKIPSASTKEADSGEEVMKLTEQQQKSSDEEHNQVL